MKIPKLILLPSLTVLYLAGLSGVAFAAPSSSSTISVSASSVSPSDTQPVTSVATTLTASISPSDSITNSVSTTPSPVDTCTVAPSNTNYCWPSGSVTPVRPSPSQTSSLPTVISRTNEIHKPNSATQPALANTGFSPVTALVIAFLLILAGMALIIMALRTGRRH